MSSKSLHWLYIVKASASLKEDTKNTQILPENGICTACLESEQMATLKMEKRGRCHFSLSARPFELCFLPCHLPKSAKQNKKYEIWALTSSDTVSKVWCKWWWKKLLPIIGPIPYWIGWKIPEFSFSATVSEMFDFHEWATSFCLKASTVQLLCDEDLNTR